MTTTLNSFSQDLDKLRQSSEYQAYRWVRERVLRMRRSTSGSGGVYQPSEYWTEELEKLDYMLDASPLIIRKLREHTHHVTGLSSYEYRSHQRRHREKLAHKLDTLKAMDDADLLVPESPVLGGFGHEIDGALYNVDTLKFYEILLGMHRAGILQDLQQQDDRPLVWEIGAGWGGFAYQFKKQVPDATYLILDFPELFLFSAVYLKNLFPSAKMRMFGDVAAKRTFEDWQEFDFIFAPHTFLQDMAPERVDLTINMVSFQEMTSEQVRSYCEKAAALGCPRMYSLNRERSKYNEQLSSVSKIIGECYRTRRIPMLELSYNEMEMPAPQVAESTPREPFYQHILGTLAPEQAP